MATKAEVMAAARNAEFILEDDEFYAFEQWRWKNLNERLDQIEAMLRELGAGQPNLPSGAKVLTCGVCGTPLSFKLGAANYCQRPDDATCRHPQMVVGRR